MFDITNYCEFSNNRASCPNCELEGKPNNKNLALVPDSGGAYKCFRGCTPDQIRKAIGAPKPAIVPQNLAKPPKVAVTPAKVREACDRLLKEENKARQWLNERGISDEMLRFYQLGLVRAKDGDRHYPAIAIPIPATATTYYQKKRIAPWTEGVKPWSQFGIPAMVYTTHQPDQARETWLCEGEWDAIMLGWLVRHSHLAVDIQVSCFTCGAGNVPGSTELEKLTGTVISFYDLDEAGAAGQQKLGEKLGDRARAAIVPYPEGFSKGWDVSDAIQAGFTLEDFAAAAAAAAKVKPMPEEQKENKLKQRVITHDELMARAPDYTDWLVQDLLTSDELFLLAASPRAGKSLMAMTLAQSVATGTPFLGRPVGKGAVLYIRCEDSEAKTKERALAQGWAEGLPVYWLDRFKLSQLPELAELCDEIDPRLIIFDTLSRIRDDSISESSAEMSHVLEPLQNLCQEKRCTGLLVHHTGKISVDNAGSIEVFDTIRGSSAIRAVCRGVLVLAASDRKYRLFVENGWGKHDLDVLLDANTMQWKLLGNWVGEQVDLSQKDRALEYLNQVGQATIEQIAEGTNLPKASLYKVLSRLQSEDMVTKQGNRRQAIYIRARIGQIGQSESLSNSPNPIPQGDSGVIGQKNILGIPSEKVINGVKSDHDVDPIQPDLITLVDHFPPPTPCQIVRKVPQTQAAQAIAELDNNLTSSDLSEKVIIVQKSDHADEDIWLDSDCQILHEGDWIPARYIGENPRMRVSKVTRKMEPAHRVLLKGGKRLVVSASELRIETLVKSAVYAEEQTPDLDPHPAKPDTSSEGE